MRNQAFNGEPSPESDIYDHHHSPVINNPCYLPKYRIFIVITATLVVIIGEILTIPTAQIECINDPIHNLTQGVNNMILEKRRQQSDLSTISFANILQISSSLILDSVSIFMGVYWVLYSRTFRYYFVLLVFYFVRVLHLQLLRQPFPPGYYWEDPGFPSLVVWYGWMNDYFYSGHCGFLMICILEMRRVGKYKTSYLFLVFALYETFIVLVFRIHYMIDVLGAFVYANWIYRLTCDYEVQIDQANKYFIDGILRICCRKANTVKTLQNEVEVPGRTSITPGSQDL